MPPILQLHHITRQFSRHVPPAVDAVSLTLQAGELLALLGPSGCGKTTLLRLIAGFEAPQDGTIAIAQRVVAGKGEWQTPEQRGVGMVFQDYALFPHLTVAQNVAFGLSDRSKTATMQVKEAIALVKLQGFEQRYPHQLSGGQQQRVALARALAPRPFLILLDEPLSNLDVQVRLELRQELRAILRAATASAILVTHDQEEALSIADQVAVMRQGRIEQIGTPEQLYQTPTSRFVAQFVAQANLVPAQRHGAIWQTELGGFPVSSGLADMGPQQADLLVRPEMIALKPDDMSEIVITDRQFLGRDYRYVLRTPSGQELIARIAADQPLPIGLRVRVAITEQTIQILPC